MERLVTSFFKKPADRRLLIVRRMLALFMTLFVAMAIAAIFVARIRMQETAVALRIEQRAVIDQIANTLENTLIHGVLDILRISADPKVYEALRQGATSHHAELESIFMLLFNEDTYSEAALFDQNGLALNCIVAGTNGPITMPPNKRQLAAGKEYFTGASSLYSSRVFLADRCPACDTNSAAQGLPPALLVSHPIRDPDANLLGVMMFACNYTVVKKEFSKNYAKSFRLALATQSGCCLLNTPMPTGSVPCKSFSAAYPEIWEATKNSDTGHLLLPSGDMAMFLRVYPFKPHALRLPLNATPPPSATYNLLITAILPSSIVAERMHAATHLIHRTFYAGIALCALGCSLLGLILLRLREQSMAMEQITAARDQLELINSTTPSAIFSVDKDLHITSWNQRAEEITGYTYSEVIGQPCHNFIGPLFQKGCALLKTGAPETSFGEEIQITRKDGQLRQIAQNTRLIRNAAGEIQGLIESFEDITDRREAEKTIHTLVEASVGRSGSDLYKTMAVAIAQWLEAEQVLIATINPEEDKLLPLATAPRAENAEIPLLPDSAAHKTLSQGSLLVPANAHSRFPDDPTLAASRVEGFIAVAIPGSGTPIGMIAAFTKKPIQSGEGSIEVLRILAARAAAEVARTRFEKELMTTNALLKQTAEEANESRRAALEMMANVESMNKQLEAANTRIEAAIEQANQMTTEAEFANTSKSQFLANMSHEIRTPMNGIIGFTNLVLETDLTSTQRDYILTVKKSAQNLLSLINDILDFSKLEAGKFTLDDAPFNLEDAVYDTIQNIIPRTAEKNIELLCKLDTSLPKAIFGDRIRFQQVLLNLLSNAAKFTDKGEIEIGMFMIEPKKDASTHDFKNPNHAVSWARLSVRDTGPGISPDKIDMIFQPFNQADGSISRRYGGTGLGLSICQQLVEKWGGQITIESRLNHGSVFSYTIPIRTTEIIGDAEKTSQHSELANLPVLIAESHPITSSHLMETARQWGMMPVCVESCDAAIETARTAAHEGRPFQLALVDMTLSDSDGLKLVQLLRSEAAYSATPILLLTASANKTERNMAESFNVRELLQKPISPSKLLTNILAALSPMPMPTPSASATTSGTKELDEQLSLCVLLVDDHPVNRMLARKLIEKLGHNCQEAHNGRQALALFAKNYFDLIFMDVQMPDMSGFDVTKRIRNTRQAGRNPNIPIIAMTAHAMKGDRERCLEAGMDDYVSKPLNIEDIAAAMSRISAKKQPDAQPVPAAEFLIPHNIGVFNPKAPLERIGDLVLFREILELFLEDASTRVPKLISLIEAQDARLATIEAHSLKGAASNVGAVEFTRLAHQAELAGAAGNLKAAADLAGHMLEALQRFETASKNFKWENLA